MNRRDFFKSGAFLGASWTGAAWADATWADGVPPTATDAPDNTTDDGGPGRWSRERAAAWYAKFPWIVGCNYVVSTAVNQLEMWQADTFDPETIDSELGWAEAVGLNTVRFFMHDLAWRQDPEGFKKRVATFHEICAKHHIWTIPTFFTNGGPGVPIKIGKQPEPIPGVHNSQWLESPGIPVVNDPTRWGPVEEYVSDMLSSFAQDERVLVWCLYNEPENAARGGRSLPLMRRIWRIGRAVAPSQPFTAPITLFPGDSKIMSDFAICSFIGENCDLMSFHCYRPPEQVTRLIDLFKNFDRPLICTEYLDRPHNNFFNVTPIFKERNIGAIHFGLVNGKCNFQFHSPEELPEPKDWKHDIFRKDGTPFDPKEIEQIKKLTGKIE